MGNRDTGNLGPPSSEAVSIDSRIGKDKGRRERKAELGEALLRVQMGGLGKGREYVRIKKFVFLGQGTPDSEASKGQ